MRRKSCYPAEPRGEVIQTFLGQKPPHSLGKWDAFSGRPPTTLHASGNLARPAVAVNASTSFVSAKKFLCQ
ncbi:MAG: hypothetical protein RLZZ522_1015 [Verrucomicrobiota bacterium]